MATIQLDPPIPVITPKGEGYAHVLIDYGPEYHLLWVCFLDDTGECWTLANPDIRGPKNVTMGRREISPFHAPAQSKRHPAAPVGGGMQNGHPGIGKGAATSQ